MPCAAMLGADETGRALSTRRGLHYITKHPDGAQGSTSLAQACRHVQAADSLPVQRSTRRVGLLAAVTSSACAAAYPAGCCPTVGHLSRSA